MKHTIVLGSNSPRRKEILSLLNVEYTVRVSDVEEVYPLELDKKEVPIYLAELKSNAIEIKENELLITSDTIVLLENTILGKPTDKENAIEILEKLSGKVHQVITGVTLRTTDKKISFSETTQVYFNTLTKEEIRFYINNYNPMDKAGAYAIQEFIGLIGIQKIEGCYYNVMGLPAHRVYKEIQQF